MQEESLNNCKFLPQNFVIMDFKGNLYIFINDRNILKGCLTLKHEIVVNSKFKNIIVHNTKESNKSVNDIKFESFQKKDDLRERIRLNIFKYRILSKTLSLNIKETKDRGGIINLNYFAVYAFERTA